MSFALHMPNGACGSLTSWCPKVPSTIFIRECESCPAPNVPALERSVNGMVCATNRYERLSSP